MSGRSPHGSRSQVSPRRPDERRRAGYEDPQDAYEPAPRRRGPHIGPVVLTPVRVFLLIALLGGLAFLAWSVLVRDQLQVPLMATGFAICGIVFAFMAVLAVMSVVRAGRARRDGTAVLAAIVGGLIAVLSMMCLAAAVIFSLIWSATPAT
jgi:hypothetical protein